MEQKINTELTTELNTTNYFSKENALEFMGASQFKDFLKCEECALKKISGEYVPEETDALLVGSYIDAHFSNEMGIFKQNHPNMYTRTGDLYAKYQKANDIIARIERDEVMMKYLTGEKQVIMTGVINGVKFKIKIDNYIPNKCIVDQKIVKDFEPIWDAEEHTKKNFIDYWGYDIQGAIYQEVVRQNTGLKLPFVIAVATKEPTTDIELFEIPQVDLDNALDLVKKKAPRFDEIKKGIINASRCGHCDYCKETKKLTGIKNYHELDEEI